MMTRKDYTLIANVLLEARAWAQKIRNSGFGSAAPNFAAGSDWAMDAVEKTFIEILDENCKNFNSSKFRAYLKKNAPKTRETVFSPFNIPGAGKPELSKVSR